MEFGPKERRLVESIVITEMEPVLKDTQVLSSERRIKIGHAKRLLREVFRSNELGHDTEEVMRLDREARKYSKRFSLLLNPSMPDYQLHKDALENIFGDSESLIYANLEEARNIQIRLIQEDPDTSRYYRDHLALQKHLRIGEILMKLTEIDLLRRTQS